MKFVLDKKPHVVCVLVKENIIFMKKSFIVSGLLALSIFLGSWSLPSNPKTVIIKAQETPVEHVELKLTAAEIAVEHGSEFNPKSLLVSGKWDTLNHSIVDTSTLGEHVVYFQATKGLETVKLTKKIVVKDTVKPKFTKTVGEITLEYDEERDVKQEFAASDNVDGELTVTIEGTYDKTVAGTYNLVAVAKDLSDNEIRHEFKVIVKEKPAPVVAEQTSTQSNVSVVSTGSITPSYSYDNYYSAGWCTWWVQERRIQNGAGLPNNLGNAITWSSRAAGQGYSTGYAPVVGAVATFPGQNHVAFVENVYADGSILISEMGWNYQAFGYNERVLSPDYAAQLLYIY